MRKFNPRARVPTTDFRDRNAVEKYLECGRFKQCANLVSLPAVLPPTGTTVYLPVCTENRFNKTGFATHIEMPVPGKPLSPLTYVPLGQWASLISCPGDCRGYKNRSWAKFKDKARVPLAWVAGCVIKPTEIWWAAFWAWVMK